MQLRTLGRTGKQVSALGFGCWAIGGNSYGSTDDRESQQALSFAFDQGINFFDTADIYGEGHSETLIGETFRESSKRLKVLIATKAGWDFYHGGTKKNFSPEHIRFACGESLKRLQTDYIDLFQLHNPSAEDIRKGELFKVLESLKKEGKILHYGTSIHTLEEGQAAVEQGGSDSVQIILNMIDQRPAGGLLQSAKQKNIGVIAREPLACGLLSGKYGLESQFHRNDHRNRWSREKYLKDLEKIKKISTAFDTKRTLLKKAALEFVLSFDEVSTVIPGMKTAEHVEDHIKAVLAPTLLPDEIAGIRSFYGKEELFQIGFFRN